MASSTSVFQDSIHSFLSSIPSQASDFAINAVNCYIEDQITDPDNFTRNISRVSSVFTKSKRNKGGHDGGGDCPNVEQKCFLTLPRKIRNQLWRYLDEESVKTVRLVCAQLRYEMDYDFGLSVVLNSDYFRNSMWMRSISIRGCSVQRMEDAFDLNLFAKPEKLEKLFLNSDFYFDVDVGELIIRKFQNLRQLTMYTEDIVELKNDYGDAFSNGHSSSVITRLEDQFQLTSLDVKFDTSKWKLRWNIQLKPQTYEKYWNVQNVIGQFGCSGIAHIPLRDLSKKTLKAVTLSIPFVQDCDRVTWLKILESQNVISTLTCDLNATHWQEYEKIVKANRKTLQKLFLLNLVNIRFPPVEEPTHLELVEQQKQDTPFDWKMFEDCNALQEVTLIADSVLRNTVTSKSTRYMNCVNLSSLHCPMLRAVWLENFEFSDEDVALLTQSSDDDPAKLARFELCTLKNCKIGEVEVSERQIGIKKGRMKSPECLSFGTISYTDEDLNSFEKYSTELSLAANNDLLSDNMDMVDFFQIGGGHYNDEETGLGAKLLNNANIIGGVFFTAWLVWC